MPMLALLAIAISFPSVVFTVLLSVVLIYWLFVLSGVFHINMLGEGTTDGLLEGGSLEGVAKGGLEGVAKGGLDGVAKGALEGVAKGGLEGVAKGGLEGVAKGGLEGVAKGGLDGVAKGGLEGAADAHGDVDIDSDAGLLAALKLRSAPATVVLSLIITFSWLFSVLGVQALNAWLPATAARIASFSLILLAPLLALPVTSLMIRPLGRFFLPPDTAAHPKLIGKTCVVRTGEVTKSFGEATVEDGGAGLVVRVRVEESAAPLARGDQAVIIDYDAERAEFTVVPLDALMGTEQARAKRD